MMDLSKPITIKQEVEDSIEVPILTPLPPPPKLQSLGQNYHLKDVGGSEILRNETKSPYFRKENVHSTFQIPSTLPVRSSQLQVPATLILSTKNPPFIQVSPSSTGGSIQPSRNTMQIPATSLLVNSLPVKTPVMLPPSMRKLPSFLPKGELPSLTPTKDSILVPAPLPAIDNVVKPKKKRPKKRYVFSKPKRRSKKMQELPPNSHLDPLMESYVEHSKKNDADSDKSSDTIIADDVSTDDNTELIPEASTSAEIKKPAELARLLIRGNKVKLLPNKAVWQAAFSKPQTSSPNVMKTPGSKTGTLRNSEIYPMLSGIKKKSDESTVSDSASNISVNKKMENNSLLPSPFTLSLENEAGFKKTGKKQTARKGRKKPNTSRPAIVTSEENIRNLIENVVVESANTSSSFIDPFDTIAVDKTINLPMSETASKEQPVRTRAAAKRKSPQKNSNTAVSTEVGAVVQSVTESEGLLYPSLTKSPKAPKRKRAATSRMSPKKKSAQSAIAVEIGENSNISETIPSGKPKRKRAPAKKKKPNPVESDVMSHEVVESSLVVSVKKELGNCEFQDASIFEKSTPLGSNTGPFSTNTAATSKPLGCAEEKMIVSLSFEEEASNKEEEGRQLLLAFGKRNTRSQYSKTPQTFQRNITPVGISSNFTSASTFTTEIQTSKPTEKALPLSYLWNSEAIKNLSSDALSDDASRCALNIPLDISVQEKGSGFPLNLNIKEEVVTENNSMIDKSSANEQSPKELSIPSQQLTNQPAVQNTEIIVTDYASKLPLGTTKKKQVARRGRKAKPAGQLLQTSNEFSSEPSMAVATDTTVSELTNIQTPQTTKKKQTARRGRGKAKSRRGRCMKITENVVEKLVDFSSHLEPVATPHQVDLNPPSSSIRPPNSQIPNSSIPPQLSTVSVDFSSHLEPVSTSVLNPQSSSIRSHSQIPKPITSQQLSSVSVDISSHLDSVSTSHQVNLNLPSSSIVPKSHVPKSSVSQPPSCSSNISIKTEPKDPEYEVIILDDSPIKITPPKNVDNASLQHSRQLNFSGDNLSVIATSMKDKAYTEPENIHAVTSHYDTSTHLNMPQPTQIESSLLPCASPIPVSLGSDSEARNKVNVSEKVVSTMDSNTAVYESSIANFSPEDDTTQPTPDLPCIKKEMEDNYAPTLFPDGSPSFLNCLSSGNSRKEPQLAAANSPVYSTPDNAHTGDSGFHTTETARTSSKTLEETWNLPGPSTDAVYSNTLSKPLEGYDNANEKSNEDFQQTSSYHVPSNQNTFVHGNSTDDTLAFSNVSIEALKNIVGSMDIMPGTEAQEASRNNSVISNIDKDLPFRLDYEDSSSRTSSFLSRSSPRLSTPLSECASLRLTDSVSPLTRVPENSLMASTSYQALDVNTSESRCSSQGWNGLTEKKELALKPSDVKCEYDEFKVHVGQQLRIAARLPQYSIKNEGDFIPLENFSVSDGEVDIFHKLLLAASSSNLAPKPLDTKPRATCSPALERTDFDLKPETVCSPKPTIELNRTCLLDQFIMSKRTEDNSINRGQNILAHHRVQNEHPSLFNRDELNIKPHVYQRNTLPNSDFSFASRRSELTFNSDVKMELTDPKSDNFVPCPIEVKPQNNIALKSSGYALNASELNYSPLPNVAENNNPDLNILPDMLMKLLSNLKESSSKTTTETNMQSPFHGLLPDTDNNRKESDPWKMENSNTLNIPAILTSHSFASSSLTKSINDIQEHTLHQNSDKVLYNQTYSSNNSVNITLPSNELLYSVIKNTTIPPTDYLCGSFSSRGLNIDAKTLNDASIERDVLQLPQAVSVTNSDLHNSPTNESVSNLEEINKLAKKVATSEMYVETMGNLSVTKPSDISCVESFATLTESQPESSHQSAGASNTGTEENIQENFTVGPANPNAIARQIDVSELLKILNTAKSLPANIAEPFIEPSHFDETYNHAQAGLEKSSHLDYISSQGDNYSSYDSPANSYRDNFRKSSNYKYPSMQTPFVHDYGHQSCIDPFEEAATNLPATNTTENLPSQSNNQDSSDSEVDTEFVNNESDLQEESVQESDLQEESVQESDLQEESVQESDHQEESTLEDCIEAELSSDTKEESSKEEEKEKNIPYKSRWQRIMERKSEAFEKEQHLLQEHYSAKVPKSKAKIQKPIAHVQPCTQSSTKKKIIEETGLSLQKKVAKQNEAVTMNGAPLKKKAKSAEDSSSDMLKEKNPKKVEDVSSSLPLKKKKSKKGEHKSKSSRSHKKKKSNEEKSDILKKSENISVSGLPLKKKKTNQDENTSTHGLSLKKKSTSELASPIAKKSKLDSPKSISKKHSPVKPQDVLLEDPSNLFTPDKIKIVKKREAISSGAPKDKEEAAKRLYGRVTNRGSFLTQPKQSSMPKNLKEKKNTDKTKSIKRYADEHIHSMISTPDIRIAPERDLLQKHSRKHSLESYKMKKRIFDDINTGIGSPRVDFQHMSPFRHTPTSSAILSSVSPDNSFLASSDSSDFLSPTYPFDSNLHNPALPHFERANNTFSRTLLSNPENVHPAVMKHPLYTKRPLLPDPVSSFVQGHSSTDFRHSPVTNSQFQSLLLNTPIEIPSSPVVQQPVIPPQHASSRNRPSRPRATTCVCLPPKTLKASVGKSLFKTFDVMLLILEWNVDWLFQQQKNLEPPPISNTVQKVANSYHSFEEYYNAYLPLLLLETWQRIYASWTHLHQAAPYFCEITSYTVETYTIKVECHAVFRASDAERGIFPEEGNIVMVKFGTKEKGGIKILGYVTDVKVKAFNPYNDPQNTCYRTLKYTASEELKRISLTFLGAYNSDDFDRNQLIRIQVLCSINPTLKQNDAMLNIEKSPLSTNIINPLNDGLRMVNVITRHPDPLKVSETVNDCVRDIIKGIFSPHPLPLLTIAKSLPSSDRLLVLLPLIEQMKHSYKTKVLLCTRTAKALTDIGFHLEGGTLKVVIVGSRVDIHQKLKKYHLDDQSAEKATSNLPSPLPGFQKSASKEAIESAKADILQNCDVILSNIRNCHNDFFEKVLQDGDCIPQMCCIIDEANLCTDPEISIPLLYGISKLILIGDPDVLAKVCSKTAITYDYNRSLFHRAHDLDLASE